MGRFSLLFSLLISVLIVPSMALAQRSRPCPNCARTLNLTPAQWHCLHVQLPRALSRPRDPGRFEVNGCEMPGRPVTTPPCPTCPLKGPLVLTLTLAQQRCVNGLLSRGIPARPIRLQTECGRERRRG
jgi:hypothetical protein